MLAVLQDVTFDELKEVAGALTNEQRLRRLSELSTARSFPDVMTTGKCIVVLKVIVFHYFR